MQSFVKPARELNVPHFEDQLDIQVEVCEPAGSEYYLQQKLCLPHTNIFMAQVRIPGNAANSTLGLEYLGIKSGSLAVLQLSIVGSSFESSVSASFSPTSPELNWQ